MTGSHAFGTRCIHAGEAPDPVTGAHGIPLYQNVTFAFQTNGQVEDMRSGDRPHFTYSPRGNPTVRCLEVKIADLEGTQSCVALNSGMAAISGTLLKLLANGGHVVASHELYDLTRTFLADDLAGFGASVTFVDVSDLKAVTSAITPQTRAIYAEPFSNPMLSVTDPRPLANLAHENGLTLVIDNTFLSPALFRPAEFGADIVIHSATKYLSGHGQVQGGVVCGPRHLIDQIREQSLHFGSSMPPFSAWILLSGIHTLPLRVTRHGENAFQLAELLDAHPEVDTVNYPGLRQHPKHDLASTLVGKGPDRYGGMFSFSLVKGRNAFGPFLDALELCTIAVSLGDCSTLVWPWHNRNLIRVSTGLEDPGDLERDFTRALAGLALSRAAD